MSDDAFEKKIEDLRLQLESSTLNWLLGAGISCNSNIPLMYPLTARVKEIIESNSKDVNSKDINSKKDLEIFNLLNEELDTIAHIEHYLSHLGDLIALAERTKNKTISMHNIPFSVEELLNLYKSIIMSIGDTIRYGYTTDGTLEGTKIGEPNKSIVDIEQHLKFVQAIYTNKANLKSRSRQTFFTTNYDTLLEDALGFEKYTVIDGFSGGAVAFWNPHFEFKNNLNNPNTCFLYKLHGSIDWQRNKEKGIIRVRYGTKYMADKSDIMIYPQATKYIESQKDPFSFLFSSFRNAINNKEPNVLITCGYSFGDEHINAEIEDALSMKENNTTLIAFTKEISENGFVINKTLDSWLKNKQFSNRIYVAGSKGIYNNSISPINRIANKELNWWTFSGLTNFITTGEYE